MALAPRAARPLLPLRPLSYALLLIVLLGLLPQPLVPPAPTLPAPERSGPVDTQALTDLLGRLPLVFEPAAARAGAGVRFQARALGGTLLFDPAGLRLARPDTAGLRLRFVDGAAAALEPTDPLPGRVSRFLGSDPAEWQQDLPTSAGLRYRRLYPGVDLRYDGAAGRLKGTYLLAPGADPARIRWRYEGAVAVGLDPSGDLRIELAPGLAGGAALTLAERAPVAWQETSAGRVEVAAAYDLAADGSVGFRLGRYDPHRALTIDPILEFSTYLGGPGFDSVSDIALDAQGNIYAVGTSHADGFPLKDPLQPAFGGGASDVVLLKLSPGGTALLFSTYLGGQDADEGARVLVDQQGIAVLGDTKSANFPATLLRKGSAGDWDMFVARLDLGGKKLVWSGLLGGSNRDVVRDAALDGAGRVTLIGHTQSDNFPAGAGAVYQPTAQSANSAVVAQLSPDGAALTFRTYLGGAAFAYGNAIAFAPDGGIVVAGQAQGGFPIKNPLPGMGVYHGGTNDGFVAKLAPGATDLVFSTYLGGGGDEGVNELVLDSAGTIYVTGTTDSGDFPRVGSSVEAAGRDGFVSKLSADGQQLLYSAFQGGGGDDQLARIALDSQRNIYLLGSTSSTVVEVNQLQPPPPQNGKPNLLLIKLSNDGQITQICTLLGGSDDDRGHDTSSALAVSPAGQVVLGSFTASLDLPLRNPIQPSLAGDFDALLMVIDTAPRLGLKVTSSATMLAPCASDPCPEVDVTWTLTVPHKLDATLAVTLPTGLELVPGSLTGAELAPNTNTLRYSGQVLPSVPHLISYQVRPRAGLLPGSLLPSSASATTAGAPLAQANLTLALPDQPTGTLVMIYASGDNDLRDATLLLATQAESGARKDGVVGVLLLDGLGDDDTYLYKLQPPDAGRPDCFERLDDPSCDGRYVLGKTYWKWSDNLASPDTLADFVAAAQRAFPAQRRVLSLVGHGGGWSPTVLDEQPGHHHGQPSRHGGQLGDRLGGMLWDLHSDESLSTAELAAALRLSQQQFGPLDLLYLDACGMGQIEVAYELRDSAHYLLASPNWKWAAFPYDLHLQSADVGDGKAIGLAWIANERAALAAYTDEPYTYTLLDLGQIEALREAVNVLAGALKNLPPNALKTAFSYADRYDENMDGALDPSDNTLDLGSFAAQITLALPDDAALLQATDQVSQTLRSTVVAGWGARGGRPWPFPTNIWGWDNSTGLSMYLPLEKDDWRRRYYRTLAFGAKSAWADLLDQTHGYAIPPADPTCAAPCALPPGQLLRRQLYLPLLRR